MGLDRLKCGNIQPLCQRLRETPAPSRCTHRQWYCCGSTITSLSLFVEGDQKTRVQERLHSYHWMHKGALVSGGQVRCTLENWICWEIVFAVIFVSGFLTVWCCPPGHNEEEPSAPLRAWNKTLSSPFLPYSHHSTFLWKARFSAHFRVTPALAGCGLR